MREQTVAVTTAKPAVIDLSVVRGETLKITLTGSSAPQHVMTISASQSGPALIEIPAVAGMITLDPALLQVLQGWTYYHNIWAQASGVRTQLVTGAFRRLPSILPAGTDIATLFLEDLGGLGGPQAMVSLTRAQYAALSPPDPDTLYLIREVA